MSRKAFEKVGSQIVDFVLGLEHMLKYALAAEYVDRTGLHVFINNEVEGDEHWVARSATGDRFATGDTWFAAVEKFMEEHDETHARSRSR